jgi:uroporphyrinogen decarboxylase
MPGLSSRERLLLTIEHKETDYLPCSFMMFHGLRDRYPGNWKAFIEAQLDLGLDTVAELPELLFSFHQDVKITEWKENIPGKSVLYKKYDTPAGFLQTEIEKSDDWPHGDHIEFYDDHNVPRSRKFHVNGRIDLKSFRYMMLPPTADQIKTYREKCAEVKKYANQKGLLVRGVRGVLIDAAIRFAGVENLVFAAMEDPGYLEEYLNIIWDWSMQRMEIILDEKPDMFLRRGWYENMSFWSPEMFRKFMKPYLEKEVCWAHEAGVKFGYINTCSYMNLTDDFIDTGIDMLIGVDPVQDAGLDMAALKQKTKGRICLWGGGNGFVTVEKGTPEQIRNEVFDSIDKLAPGGGFILSPVDNVRDTSDTAISSANIFIDAWKEKRYGIFK